MSEISASVVKELRQKTGAGFMDCKRALSESGGDVDAAADLLRKRGVELAAKKAGRATSQGWIGSYVHSNGRIGVLVELNCETDFVARNDKYQVFLKDLCMHVAAMNPLALTPEDLDPELVEKERSIYADQVKDKPDGVREKIAEGKLNKYFSEVCLLHQPFVRDDKKTVQEVLTEQIATIGENMSIRRFVRLEMGQGG
ncbi:MAG: translation elongation factor Ts [Planctomycetota bacterium]